jgi:cell division transport system permease protein
MFILSIARVIKSSIQDVGRNIWLSVATITILVLALFSVNILLVVKVISTETIQAVKEKIDVSLYLKSDATDVQIANLQEKVSGLTQVNQVDYISKAEALETFRLEHKNDPEILEALVELGKNPLSPSLIVKPKDIDRYDELIESLVNIEDDIIESKNFDDHKAMITKINLISDKASQAGLFISSLFVIIMLLVVYNSIRVAIYTHKREIGIMKLVGASNWFIKAPYLVSSLIYTFIGILITVALFYPFLGFLQPYLSSFFDDYGFNLISFYNSNFFTIFGLEFLAAALINIFASLIAVGKYSKV